MSMAAFDSSHSTTVGILVPAYQAAATIGNVVRACRFFSDRVLVVDDGSTDDTAALAEGAGAKVLRLPKNGGKGGALRAGFSYAQKTLGWTDAITMDADQQHAASDIPRFLEAHRKRPGTFLLGQRSFRKMPGSSRFTGTMGLLFLSFSARRFMRDTQCGFRLYPLNWVNRLNTRGTGFEFESEILLIAGRTRFPIGIVPIQTRYYTGKMRQKHVRARDTWEIIFLFYESLRPKWLRKRRGY